MVSFYLTHPAAAVAYSIESLELHAENKLHGLAKSACKIFSRMVSVTAFPLAVASELVFRRAPRLIATYVAGSRADAEKFHAKLHKRAEKVQKYFLGVIASPLGFRHPNGVSGLFLKTPSSNQIIRPFGVEELYGKRVDRIHYPKSAGEVQTLVARAKAENRQISIIGAGMSQGQQTVPVNSKHLVIHTKNLNQISFEQDNKKVTVGAGAIWEKVQLEAHRRNKSVIVKQASDIFSVGGSIGINCHGWAHEWGAIGSTVASIDIIDAEGNLKTLTPQDEQFGCFFGTLGYFGIIVSATLKLVDNEPLIEKTKVVNVNQFCNVYETEVKGKDIPLFGGRLVLDEVKGDPFRAIYMNCFEKDLAGTLPQEPFVEEPPQGTLRERILLQLVNYSFHFSVRRFISKFWDGEAKNMLQGRKISRNAALHPPIKAFNMLRDSRLRTQWLQEYFIKKENLPNFLRFLGAELKANHATLINATIRPTPKDSISVLPYAEEDRYAVVICFNQKKTDRAIQETKRWMKRVNSYVIANQDRYYQAYMPFQTQEEFEKCYGQKTIENLRNLKEKYDPEHRFGNAHTAKYFDKKSRLQNPPFRLPSQ